MRRIKLLVTLLCIVIMTSTISLPVLANSNDNLSKPTPFKISAPGNTLSKTQNEYLTEAKNTISQSIDDDQKIESICETFLTLAKASVRDPQNYDCSQLINADRLKKNTVQYRLTDYKYQSALNKALGWKILDDDLIFTDFKVQNINNTYAVASVVESYTYYITDGFNDKSFRRKMYTFELVRDFGEWKITNVTTDDPWETDANFKYAPIDVENAVNAHLAEAQMKSPEPIINENKDIKASNQVLPSATMYSWTYDTSKAVAYAEAHYKDTSN